MSTSTAGLARRSESIRATCDLKSGRWSEGVERLVDVGVDPGDGHVPQDVGGPALERGADEGREHAVLALLHRHR